MYKRFLCCILLLNVFLSIAGDQKLTLNKQGLIFSLELLSSSLLSYDDTLKIKYTVTNNSISPIAVLDLDIPGKVPIRPLSVNDKMAIELNLGGRGVVGLNTISKFRIVKKKEFYSMVFELPVSVYIEKLHEHDKQKKINWQRRKIKDVTIVALIAYSDEEEFYKGSLKAVTEFEDYRGYLEGWEGTDVEAFLTMIELSGITLEINLLISQQ